MLSAASGGLILLLLAPYLSWWVKLRNKNGLSLYLYLATTIAIFVLLFAEHFIQSGVFHEIGTAVLLAWWATGFVLRKELRGYFGSEFEISPLLTALLSVFYLDYCLWAISNAHFPERRF